MSVSSRPRSRQVSDQNRREESASIYAEKHQTLLRLLGKNTFTPSIYAETHQTLLRLQGKNTFTPSYYLDKCQTLLRLQGKTRDNSASTAIYTVDRMQYTVRVKCNRELRCDIVNSRIFQPYLSI